MSKSLADLIAGHPCPQGYTPVKSPLGELMDRYGVGDIPLPELHRINTISRAQLDALHAKDRASARAAAASEAAGRRHEQMALEWEASHGGR